MSSRSQGFTLIEVLIVVAVIAIIATIAIPNLLSARLSANESAAVATLRNISSAQAQCQAASDIDANRNGAGEYGFFAELSGAVPVRNDESGGVGTVTIAPPVLSGAFGNVQGSQVIRSGYHFQMYLPDSAGAGQAEAPGGGAAGVSIDARKAEVAWCSYAWPSVYANSGKRAFFVNQAGDVLACRNAAQQYSGTLKAPLFSAAFLAGTSGFLDNQTAAQSIGLDGQRWVVIN